MVVICIELCLCDAQVAQLIGTLLHSLLWMKRIFLAGLGFRLQLFCIKCSPMLTGILELAYVCCMIK